MRWFSLLILCLLTGSCTKEPFYVPQPRLFMDLYFQASEPYIIEHGHFQLQLIAYWQDASGQRKEMPLKAAYFWKNSLPFRLELPVMLYKIDSLQQRAQHNKIDYHLKLRWDSNGNGALCQGDLSFDYRMCSPYVSSTEERQVRYLKPQHSAMGCGGD